MPLAPPPVEISFVACLVLEPPAIPRRRRVEGSPALLPSRAELGFVLVSLVVVVVVVVAAAAAVVVSSVVVSSMFGERLERIGRMRGRHCVAVTVTVAVTVKKVTVRLTLSVSV